MSYVIFLFIFFATYNCELYKKIDVANNVWNSHVYKTFDHAKSKVECGSLCKIESICHGFKYDTTCFLIDIVKTYDVVSNQPGEEIYLSVSKFSK